MKFLQQQRNVWNLAIFILVLSLQITQGSCDVPYFIETNTTWVIRRASEQEVSVFCDLLIKCTSRVYKQFLQGELSRRNAYRETTHLLKLMSSGQELLFDMIHYKNRCGHCHVNGPRCK